MNTFYSSLIFLTFVSYCTYVFTKPALNEEHRNLCESETDKAECLREVEEAKAGVIPAEQQQQDGSTHDQRNTESREKVESEEEYYARIERIHRNSEENRKFWNEELRSMNKWEKYGLA